MKDDLIIYFNKKQILTYPLFILAFLPIALYATIIVAIPNMLNNQYNLSQTYSWIFGISIMNCGILYLLYTTIYLFIKCSFQKRKRGYNYK